MKKIIPICLVVIAAISTSCTTSIAVVSKSAFDNTLADVSGQLSDKGYQLSGMSEDTKNEVSVSATSYSRYTGYGSAMRNNYWQYDEYMYTDSLNNSVSYTVKYQLKKDYDGKAFVQDVEVTNCVANKDFNEICGSNGLVKRTVSQTTNNPDMEAKIQDNSGTILAATFGTLGACAIVVILLCLL